MIQASFTVLHSSLFVLCCSVMLFCVILTLFGALEGLCTVTVAVSG